MAEFSCRPRQVDGDGAAKRRRLRRLRSWWRHEQQTVAAVLATVTHHSFGKVGTASGVLRNMETATRTGNGEEYEAHCTAKFRKTPPQGGRPAPLPEVAGWQGRLEQHVWEDLGSICPSVQILDLPVLQVVEQPEEVDSFFRNFVPAVAEQVIEVPKLALPVCAVQRAALLEPQLVEQLVEVPTVLSYSLLKQRTAEQVVDTPVPHGRGRGARGGLQGFSQGQDSTEVCGAENLVIPAPHGRGGGARGGLQGLSQGQGSTVVCGADKVVSPALHARGGGSRGGLQGLSQGQGSTAVCGADKVVSPALHARGGGSRGGLQGLSQGQGSTAVCGADNVVSPAPHGRGGSARGGLQGLSQGQGSSAVCGAENVDIPVPHGRVGKRGLHGFPRGQSSTASAVQQTVGVDRGGPQRFPRGQSSTASAFEQTFSQAPHRSLPQAPVHGRHDEWVCVVDVENDNEYYWNPWDNSTCWRLPRGVKHRWCLLPSGLYRDVVLGEEFWDLHPL